MWRGFKTLFIWRKQREAAQRAIDAADALLAAALAYDKAYRSMKARAANWLCGRMVMLLARRRLLVEGSRTGTSKRGSVLSCSTFDEGNDVFTCRSLRIC